MEWINRCYHPTQILADFLTIEEHIGKPLNKVKLVFVGDARNNMGNALMYGCSQNGNELCSLGSKGIIPRSRNNRYCKEIAKETGDIIKIN